MFPMATFRFGWLLILGLGAAFLNGCPAPPETVARVDLNRYVGLWYQVAGYPFFATRDLVAITAEYSQQDDGSVRVLNRGRVKTFDGPEDTIEGVATVEDTTTNAKLSVRFPSVLGGLLPGEYWIVALDEVDYTYAAVSDSKRRTLFLLSRTPQMDPAVKASLIDRLVEKGFDRSRIENFPQPGA